jgi:hypothetical protein
MIFLCGIWLTVARPDSRIDLYYKFMDWFSGSREGVTVMIQSGGVIMLLILWLEFVTANRY